MGKLRTRQHQIEDLGFNHIEKQILLAKFTMSRNNFNDYGIDGFIQTFRPSGEVYWKTIEFQLKSTDHIQLIEQRAAFAFDLSVEDLTFWLNRSKTVLLILYDAATDCAYFIDLDVYFTINRKDLAQANKFIRVYLPKHQVFNTQAVSALL